MIRSLPAQRGPGDTLVSCRVFEDKFKLMDCNSGFFLHDFHISHVVEFLGHDFSVKKIRHGPGAKGDGQNWSSSPLKSCPGNIKVSSF